jgi:hypothetical protein
MVTRLAILSVLLSLAALILSEVLARARGWEGAACPLRSTSPSGWARRRSPRASLLAG